MSASAWSIGAELGSKAAARSNASADEDKNAQRDLKANELATSMKGIQQNMSTVAPDSPEYSKYKDALGDAQQQLTGLYQPHEGPHLMRKLASVFGHPAPSAPPSVPVRPGMTIDEILQTAAPAYKKPLLTPEELHAGARVSAGLDAKAAPDKPETESWQTKDITLPDGKKMTAQFDAKHGTWQDLAGKPIAPEVLSGATVAPKATQHPPSQYQVERETYAKSIGKKPEEMTWKDEQNMLTQRAKSTNAYGGAHLLISQQLEHLAQRKEELDENKTNYGAFMALQKQMGPLEKVQTTAANAQEYLSHPSGTGDVALALAFVDAVKPGSGFRFTDAERRWITTGSRGIADGAITKFNGGFTGETLSPEQRQNMLTVIQAAARQASQQQDTILSGAGNFVPKAADAVRPQSAAKLKADAPMPGKSKGRRSIDAAMKLDVNKGKSRQEVSDDLKKHGYDPV